MKTKIYYIIASLLAVQTINGSVPKVIAMDFSQHPFTFWQNSSFNLMSY